MDRSGTCSSGTCSEAAAREATAVAAAFASSACVGPPEPWVLATSRAGATATF